MFAAQFAAQYLAGKATVAVQRAYATAKFGSH